MKWKSSDLNIFDSVSSWEREEQYWKQNVRNLAFFKIFNYRKAEPVHYLSYAISFAVSNMNTETLRGTGLQY